eukprot:scaffold779_cov205-Alexandrium_tamarense.AAC.16
MRLVARGGNNHTGLGNWEACVLERKITYRFSEDLELVKQRHHGMNKLKIRQQIGCENTHL